MNKILPLIIFSGLFVALGNQWVSADDKVDYTRQIKPLLEARCTSCHGGRDQQGELRLDTGLLIRKGGDSGAAIEVGKAAESLLIERVSSSDESERMPPEGDPLSQQQLALLKSWIDQGAKSPRDEVPQIDPRAHWAFKAPVRPTIPKVNNMQSVRNPIDAFVLARLEQAGIEPSAPANRATLLRRLSLDLLGLPPTFDEVDTFLQDDRPDAYGQLVNRLLKSSAFGERWGRHWLDLARYADSNGYEDDRGRPDAFRFRDWVIAAYNSDMPFDRFTTQQLAGDLLPNSSYQQQVATGFHRMTLSNEGGADTVEEEFRIIAVKDRVDTTGSVWLGLSVGCAKCHSHKYDPLSQHEYYQLFAFFNNAENSSIAAPPLPARFMVQYKKKLKEHKAKLLAAKQNLAQYEANVLPKKIARWLAGEAPQQNSPDKNLAKLINEILSVSATERGLKKQIVLASYLSLIDPEYSVAMGNFLLSAGNNAPQRPSTRAMTVATKIRKTHLHVRGNFLDLSAEVQPGTPEFLPALDPRGKVADRLDLARWIVDPRNPLTARVAVNHIWRHLLGQGLVTTPDQFGTAGSLPTHPKLLDWLATEFIRQGWSRKGMIRLIVSSATYRQSSRPAEDVKQRDPNNVLLARQSRLRLEAECVRDVALAVSGLLNRELGGPGFQPPLPTSLLATDELKSEQLMEPSEGSDRYRRGVYINVQRMFQLPMLQMFDVADPNGSCARRDRSNTPLQALTLLNGPVFYEAAEALGRRIQSQQTGSISQKILFAFRLCLSRSPDKYELETMNKFIEESAPDSELAACVILARTMINLDEFITRE